MITLNIVKFNTTPIQNTSRFQTNPALKNSTNDTVSFSGKTEVLSDLQKAIKDLTYHLTPETPPNLSPNQRLFRNQMGVSLTETVDDITKRTTLDYCEPTPIGARRVLTTFNAEGKKLKEDEYNPYGNRSTRFFNPKSGKQTILSRQMGEQRPSKVTVYDPNKYRTEKTYNSKGIQIGEQHFEPHEKMGNLISEQDYQAHGIRTKVTYDQARGIVEKTRFNENGKIATKVRHLLNADGSSRSKFIDTSSKDGTPIRLIYDGKGKLRATKTPVKLPTMPRPKTD